MMDSPQEVALNSFAQQAYCEAFARHGDLDLNAERYATQLLFVTKKHLGASLSEGTAFVFINRLHTNDLYLSIACAIPSNVAWERFIVLYQAFIEKVAGSVTCTAYAAREMADSMPGHVFLPDASGRSRIASYEGRSSLAAWLSAVINNKAIKERRRCNCLEQFDSVPDIPDPMAVERIEAALRAGTYASLIRDALTAASEALNDRERFIVSLRYQEGIKGVQRSPSSSVCILLVLVAPFGRSMRSCKQRPFQPWPQSITCNHRKSRSASMIYRRILIIRF